MYIILHLLVSPQKQINKSGHVFYNQCVINIYIYCRSIFPEQCLAEKISKLWLCFSTLNESVSSLKEFTTENVIEATSLCLHVIDDANQFSRSLPPSMSARFRLGTGLGQACQVSILHY